ncbi:MAG: radical SAM family heme chaperone HemW [Verrucomicrobiota bacterium]|nr:radical SAM family heme chaperone HemW [Verrucomicrobiota bacterium]
MIPGAHRLDSGNREALIRHLYFHIPFCAKLCPYCSFHVETAMRGKSREFLNALLREVETQSALFPTRPQTIYFGGGTPSALSLSELEYLLGGLMSRLDLSELSEFTFEINPATVSSEKARLLRALGVNRISMGVQSWEDAVLKTLGRAHTAAQSERTFDTLRAAGFENIGLDLMFAVPEQTAGQWKQTLAKTVALRPEHISAYCLTYEEDTEFFRKLGAGQFARDDGQEADFFEVGMDALCAGGYTHYEISNYALPGRESQHNAAYWRGADYLGIGPSAFSTCGERRWQNVPDSREYTRRIFANKPAVSFEEKLDPVLKAREQMMFGLRTDRGVSRDALVPWDEQVRALWDLGFLQTQGDRVALTPRGKLMADSVAEAFADSAAAP